MTGPNGAPSRNTNAILEDALHELHERERRLQPFVDELADVRRGIKTVERALGAEKAPRRSAAAAGGQREEILKHLAESMDPLSKEQLAELLGGGRGLHLSLAAMVKSGAIVEVEGGYGLPSSVGA